MSKITKIRFKKLSPEAKTPYKAIDVDAGYDLYATSIEETPDYIAYHTDIAVEIPVGFVGLIFPRSSVTKYDLMLKNCIGVIDASYRGEITCRFAKVINDAFRDTESKGLFKKFEPSQRIDILSLPRNIKKYEVGDRVAQIVFLELPKVSLIESEELSDTERGTGGFGSTGK